MITQTDADGIWEVASSDPAGVTVRYLKTPSPEYLAKRPPAVIVTENDQLKLLISALIRKGVITEADLK